MDGRGEATMILPGETEAGSAVTQPCRGIAWWAHRNDEWQRRNLSLALLPNPHRIGSAKPLGDYLDFRRTDDNGRTGSAGAAAPLFLLWPVGPCAPNRLRNPPHIGTHPNKLLFAFCSTINTMGKTRRRILPRRILTVLTRTPEAECRGDLERHTTSFHSGTRSHKKDV